MARFVVQGVVRDGHAGSWRLGRRWHADKQTEIEVLDQDGDPDPLLAKGDSVPTYGKKSFGVLTADPFLKVLPAGDPLALARAAADVPTLRVLVEAQAEEIRQLKQRLGEGDDTAGGATPKEGREPPVTHAADSKEGREPPSRKR